MIARSKIAVVGGGAAGIAAAHVLGRAHDVALFERQSALGGHIKTFTVPDGPDAGIALDAGFMAFNETYYPTFKRLLVDLRVGGIAPADMSISYSSPRDRIEYAINSGAPVRLAGDELSLGDLLQGVLRFGRTAARDLADGVLKGKTIADYVHDRGYDRRFIDHYLVPAGAVTWPMRAEAMLEFPAEAFVRFFERHGLLSAASGPEWLHFRSGSQSWVRAFEASFRGRIELGVRDLRLRRDPHGVTIETNDRALERFDFAVIATHADEALRALSDPSPEEAELFGRWRYRPCRVLVHTDTSAMPAEPSIWSAWNVMRTESGLSTTYFVNRFQRLTGAERSYFVTLDPSAPIADDRVIGEIDFAHPEITLGAWGTQDRIRAMNGACRTYYCGAYLGYSNHEDAVRSGVSVAEAFGLEL